MKIKLGIVGGGVVGGAIAKSYTEFAEEVRVYDVVKKRRVNCSCLGDVVGGTDLVFVCLPTPQKEESRECDVSALDRFFDSATQWRYQNFVLRSTVPVGTTRRLAEKYRLPNLVHSPEFLTARCAAVDANMPTRNVIGYPAEPSGGFGSEGGSLLHMLYERRFPGVPVHVMTSDESEFVKLAQNSFFALKVSYWNECREFADTLGLDWNAVLAAILADGRISPNHTQVPGPDGKFGFGGACLPKDLANLAECLADVGLDPTLCNAALRRNARDRDRV